MESEMGLSMENDIYVQQKYNVDIVAWGSVISTDLTRRPRFRIILRGKDVEHHNIVNDLMLTQEITYKPTGSGADGVAKDTNMVAVVTIGFVKDAKDHIDVQGFNVYHKNRLIKPFWRVWNAAGSDGRGVIGVLEANFVEPAHDKQGFERTTVLSRLEQRLVQMQKTYWSTKCHKIGYAPRGRQRKQVAEDATREMSPEYSPYKSSRSTSTSKDRYDSQKKMNDKGDNGIGKRTKYSSKSSSSDQAFSAEEDSDSELPTGRSRRPPISSSYKDSPSQRSLQRELSHSTHSASPNSCNSEVRQSHASNGAGDRVTRSQPKVDSPACNGNGHASSLDQLKMENSELKDRLKKMEESLRDLGLERDKNRAPQVLGNEDSDLDTCEQNKLKLENLKLKNSLKEMEESFSGERERCKSLESQLKELQQKNEEMNKEQEALIDVFSEEKNRHDGEEENLRKKLKDASNTIQQLLDRVRELEKLKGQNCKVEP